MGDAYDEMERSYFAQGRDWLWQAFGLVNVSPAVRFPEISEDVWVTRDGRRIAVNDMDIDHLKNTVAMIDRAIAKSKTIEDVFDFPDDLVKIQSKMKARIEQYSRDTWKD